MAVTGEPEIRIEYTINRCDNDENWYEIGFGSSGAWSDVDGALHAMSSDIQCRQWETTGDMPDPHDAP